MNDNGDKSAVQAAIKQLESDGFDVRFTHYRVTEWGETVRYSRKVGWLDDNAMDFDGDLDNDAMKELWYGEPAPTGGATRCFLVKDAADNQSGAFIDVTRCRSTEQFCYAQGRRISLARSIELMVDKVPNLDREVYNRLRGMLWQETHEYWKSKGNGAGQPKA